LGWEDNPLCAPNDLSVGGRRKVSTEPSSKEEKKKGGYLLPAGATCSLSHRGKKKVEVEGKNGKGGKKNKKGFEKEGSAQTRNEKKENPPSGGSLSSLEVRWGK